MKKAKKNLGKIVIDLGYVVDLDNADMVNEAKRCFYDDLMSGYNNNEIINWMEVIKQKGLTENDIPEHLLEIIEEN